MTVIGLVESIVFVNVWSRLFLVIIGTSDDMWRMTRLLTGDDDTQMTDGWQTLLNRQKLQLWNLTLSQNDSLAQKGPDHCWLHKLHDCQLSRHNGHLSSSYSRRNATLCHRNKTWRRTYVNALPLWDCCLAKYHQQMTLCCFSSSLEDLHVLISMMLGDGGSCTTTPRNSR